jgi:hypothetical protein
MSYPHRHTTKRSAASPELLYLLVVVAAGIATAWWAGHKIGLDLSSITTIASVIGLADNAHVERDVVGFNPGAPAVNTQHDSAVPAPFCNPGQAPEFKLGLARLKEYLGDTMGAAVECEHAAANGDTTQQTTTGLAAYTAQTNTVSFTDGWRHWAITPRGFVQWEGSDSQPPAG